jgi:hypothetical protein
MNTQLGLPAKSGLELSLHYVVVWGKMMMHIRSLACLVRWPGSRLDLSSYTGFCSDHAGRAQDPAMSIASSWCSKILQLAACHKIRNYK